MFVMQHLDALFPQNAYTTLSHILNNSDTPIVHNTTHDTNENCTTEKTHILIFHPSTPRFRPIDIDIGNNSILHFENQPGLLEMDDHGVPISPIGKCLLN